jgi:Domain of unknown function (DUF4192)
MNVSHPARITLSTPHDVIAAVPHLLGFQPCDSLVVLALAGPRLTVTLRYDLPQPADIPALSEHLVSCLAANRADEVILLGYGTSEQVTPVLTEVCDHLADLLTIADILRVTAGRWWSLTCTEPRCCPAEGNPCGSDGTLAAAEFTMLGSAPLPSREHVAATIAPAGGERQAGMRAAIRRAVRQLPLGWQPGQPPAEYLAEVAAILAKPAPLPDDDAARLLVLLGSIRLRDEAWAITDSGDPQAQVELWSDLTRRAPGRYAAPTASLLAYAAACMTGNGVLARAAVERALNAAPGYSLALLLLDMLDCGAPAPQLRLGLTPADLAELYRRQGSEPRPA